MIILFAKYLTRNLVARWLASLITVGSMVLVSATLCGVGALGLALVHMFQQTGSPSRVVVRSPGAHGLLDSNLDAQVLPKLTGFEGVRMSSIESSTFVASRLADRSMEHVSVRGVDPKGRDLYDVKLIEGRIPTMGAYEFMVGQTVLKRHPELAIGGKVRFDRAEYTSVGVFTAGPFYDGEIWTTRAAMMSEMGDAQASVVLLDTESPDKARSIIKQINALRGVSVVASSEPEFYDVQLHECGELFGSLAIVLVLVVASAAISAICSLAVILRRRVSDLALLRALGYGSGRLAASLLFETGLLAVGGACLGGLTATLTLRRFVAHFGFGPTNLNFHANVTPECFGLVLVLMIVIGFGSAILPIVRLRRLSVSDALRDE